jgi:hypothetical protein
MNLTDYIEKYAISPGLKAKVFDRRIVRMYSKKFRTTDPKTISSITDKISHATKARNHELSAAHRLDIASLSGGAKSSKLGREFLDQLGRAKPRNAQAIF